MPKVADQDTRAVMVLANEARRMRESAERVDLVVRAMALRRGYDLGGVGEVSEQDVDLFP